MKRVPQPTRLQSARRVRRCTDWTPTIVVAAGLRGGKNHPATGSDRPRLFVTLTAPSFGHVHLSARGRGRRHSKRCHAMATELAADFGTARRTRQSCTPLDAARYDYPGQVLFNAHAGLLWPR